MLVTNLLSPPAIGGRHLLCQLNHDLLQDILGAKLVVFRLPQRRLRGLRAALGAFSGHIDGLDGKVKSQLCKTIEAERIGTVFIDGSNLGEVANTVKRSCPGTKVISFFHNVESRFFLGALRQSRSLRALGVLAVNYLAERKAVQYSDKMVCLSERDSAQLKKVFGRRATHVAPMALVDSVPPGFLDSAGGGPGSYALFVGADFYANRAGITWFVERVAPHIGIRTCIVGRGLEDMRQQMKHRPGVEFVGEVASVSDWYRDALLVIAPVFDGSGMKTKVAEAMMFGKRVVGTPEAFSGYGEVANEVGWVCSTAEEFIRAIESAQSGLTLRFQPDIRQLYDQTYSYTAARARLVEILGVPA
jgi:hypothetical protein